MNDLSKTITISGSKALLWLHDKERRPFYFQETPEFEENHGYGTWT